MIKFFKDRIEQALKRADKLNEKDSGRAYKAISTLQRKIQGLNLEIQEKQDEREQTVLKLYDVTELLKQKIDEGFKIEALEDLAKD